MLADIFVSINVAFFERMTRPSHAQLVAERFTPDELERLGEQRALLRYRVQGRTDEALIAAAGSAEALVSQLLDALSTHFLPKATYGASAVVHYRVDCQGAGSLLRQLAVRDGRCAVGAASREETPRATLALSLRTLLETLSGIRTFEEAFRKGDIRVEGDLLFVTQLLGWFHQP
jgi:alkyl sulfatase BDS1-like metallo-beta-lactamase superfamily hydrolase